MKQQAPLCGANSIAPDPVASLGRAVVKGPSQEAWQAPSFDEVKPPGLATLVCPFLSLLA